MSGIIRAPRPEKNYCEIRNETIRDKRLSYRARGVLVRLLSNADGYKMTSVDLAGGGKEGRGAVLTALRELRRAGYLRVIRDRDRGGRWRTETYVFDVPQQDHTGVQKSDFGFPDSGFLDAEVQKNQEKKQEKKQKHAERAATAPDVRKTETQNPAGEGKKRRTRNSGIVCWLSDDVSLAEELEASTAPDALAAAVAAVRADGREPVPGRVQRELERRAERSRARRSAPAPALTAEEQAKSDAARKAAFAAFRARSRAGEL